LSRVMLQQQPSHNTAGTALDRGSAGSCSESSKDHHTAFAHQAANTQVHNSMLSHICLEQCTRGNTTVYMQGHVYLTGRVTLTQRKLLLLRGHTPQQSQLRRPLSWLTAP